MMWINDEPLSPIGRKLHEEDIEITKERRTASGKLICNVIAVKKKFTLNYNFITDEILEQLRILYEAGGTHTFKIQRPDESIDEYRVKFRPFGRARYLIGNEWYWENITITLEEV